MVGGEMWKGFFLNLPLYGNEITLSWSDCTSVLLSNYICRSNFQ
jgi:hypothetical protein